jgi:hypothetical protein
MGNTLCAGVYVFFNGLKGWLGEERCRGVYAVRMNYTQASK